MQITQEYIDFVRDKSNISSQFVESERIVTPVNFITPDEIVKRNLCDWTSADFIRFITFDITGMYEHNAQNNLIILRIYLNKFAVSENKKHFVKSTLANGFGNFYTSNQNEEPFSYSFMLKDKPNSKDFLNEIDIWQ